MTVSKKPGTPNTARTPQSAAGNGNRIVAIPRAWLIGLSVMLVLPWLVAGGIYLQSGTARARSEGAPLPADHAPPPPAGPPGGGAGCWVSPPGSSLRRHPRGGATPRPASP